MAVTGIGSSYHNSLYGKGDASQNSGAVKKTEAEDKTQAQAGKEKNVGGRTASDYYSYLKEEYGGVADGTVTISGEYLKKCAGNSKKAKELEEFLKKIPELEKQGYEQLSARNKALGGTVTYYQQTWTVLKDGSIQSTVYSVTDTGMTNAERMKKGLEERLEKRKEKKEEEKRKEQKEEKEEQAIGAEKGTEYRPAPEAEGIGMEIRYVQAESEAEAKAMMRREMPVDAYHPEFDERI